MVDLPKAEESIRRMNLDTMCSFTRRECLPATTFPQKCAMALVFRAEVMEHLLEEIYEELRLLDTSHPDYEKFRRVRDLAIQGADVWNKKFNSSKTPLHDIGDDGA